MTIRFLESATVETKGKILDHKIEESKIGLMIEWEFYVGHAVTKIAIKARKIGWENVLFFEKV